MGNVWQPDQERSCVYVEYPKCIYNQNGETMTVDNREEEDAARVMGWCTTEEYHEYLKHMTLPPAGPTAEELAEKEASAARLKELLEAAKTPGVPEGEEGHKVDGNS